TSLKKLIHSSGTPDSSSLSLGERAGVRAEFLGPDKAVRAEFTARSDQSQIENLNSQIVEAGVRAEFPHTCSASPAQEALLKPRIKQKRRKLSGYFFDQRNRVLAKLEQLVKDCALRSTAQTSATSALTSDSLSSLFDPTAEDQLLLNKLGPLLRS